MTEFLAESALLFLLVGLVLAVPFALMSKIVPSKRVPSKVVASRVEEGDAPSPGTTSLGTTSLGATYLGAPALGSKGLGGHGVDTIDPVARNSTLGFRLLIIPGCALLWPLLAARWWRVVSSEARARSAASGNASERPHDDGPEVPGDRTDLWSGPCERLRGRALVLWLVLVPLLASLLAVALLARDPAAPPATDASRLPAHVSSGAAR